MIMRNRQRIMSLSLKSFLCLTSVDIGFCLIFMCSMKIIKYQLETEINYGTPEEPDIETLLSPVTVTYTEEAYAIAQAEAFQGQITVEDDGKPEPEPKPEYVTYAELAEAIREGVNEV